MQMHQVHPHLLTINPYPSRSPAGIPIQKNLNSKRKGWKDMVKKNSPKRYGKQEEEEGEIYVLNRKREIANNTKQSRTESRKELENVLYRNKSRDHECIGVQ